MDKSTLRKHKDFTIKFVFGYKCTMVYIWTYKSQLE